MSRLGDIVGEKGMRSLVQYAAAEVGAEMWSKMLPPRQISSALQTLSEAMAARIEVVSSSDDSVVLRIAGRAVSERADAAREAMLAGFVQGVERRRTGRAPRVTIEPTAFPTTLKAAETTSRGDPPGA